MRPSRNKREGSSGGWGGKLYLVHLLLGVPCWCTFSRGLGSFGKGLAVCKTLASFTPNFARDS